MTIITQSNVVAELLDDNGHDGDYDLAQLSAAARDILNHAATSVSRAKSATEITDAAYFTAAAMMQFGDDDCDIVLAHLTAKARGLFGLTRNHVQHAWARARQPKQQEQRDTIPTKPAVGTGLKLWWHGHPHANADRTWTVEGLLPEIGTALLSGQWGLYKTFITLDLALALMVGEMFAGRPVKRRCGVLFFAAEGAFEIPLRLECAREAKYPNNKSPLPFAMADECPRLLDRTALPILQATAQAATKRMQASHGVELGLIVIDTMAAAAGFNDENDNAESPARHECIYDPGRTIQMSRAASRPLR